MRLRQTAFFFATCAALSLCLGACTTTVSDPPASSDQTATGYVNGTENPTAVAWNGGDIPKAVKKQTSNIDAFTYADPAGWTKETTDNYVRFIKSDAESGLQAEIFIGQCNDDLALSSDDMTRLCNDARTLYYNGYNFGMSCEDSNTKRFTIDGCPAMTEDATISDNPNMGECKGSMLSVGTADAKLIVGLISTDDEYDSAKADFDALVSSVHVSADQLAKVQALSSGSSTQSQAN
ncbi:MAG: hypothetical protein ACI4B6_08190 [Atopobiaceae bacterium]